jgi:hypothetical protein
MVPWVSSASSIETAPAVVLGFSVTRRIKAARVARQARAATLGDPRSQRARDTGDTPNS